MWVLSIKYIKKIIIIIRPFSSCFFVDILVDVYRAIKWIFNHCAAEIIFSQISEKYSIPYIQSMNLGTQGPYIAVKAFGMWIKMSQMHFATFKWCVCRHDSWQEQWHIKQSVWPQQKVKKVSIFLLSSLPSCQSCSHNFLLRIFACLYRKSVSGMMKNDLCHCNVNAPYTIFLEENTPTDILIIYSEFVLLLKCFIIGFMF